MEMRGETTCPNTNTPFQQVFIKNEPSSTQGSTTSLLSVHSPVLQKYSPNHFMLNSTIIENKINKMVPNNVAIINRDIANNIKSEPPDDCLEKVFIEHQEFEIESDVNGNDEIEHKKRQIIENETTVYRCQDCDGIFQRFHEYKFHKTQHSVEKRTCKICHLLCQGVTKLKEHMNVHTGLRPFQCTKCKKAFTSAHNLKCHMECHRPGFSFECEKCGKSFKTNRSLRGHMDTHAKKVKDFTCKICLEDFKVSSEFRRHLIKHGAEPPELKCHICEKVFKYETQFRSHLSTHVELKFPCQYCNKIFPSMTKIRKHVNRSHVINECEFCKQVFYDKAEFTRHKKTEHVEEKPTICEFCNKAYDKPKNLQEHIRVQHTKDGLENKCETCEKTFINRFLLNNHIKTHYRCFKCPSCNMTFSSRYNLQLHSVTHTNEKKFRCTICEKAYSSKVSLQNHITIHFDDRPFECTQCGKTFKNNRRLYVHKMSHETELKFECHTCGNKFKTKQYLKAHLYKHDKVKPFDCPYCSKRFKHKKTVEKHMEKKHQNKRENISRVLVDLQGLKQEKLSELGSEEDVESTDESTVNSDDETPQAHRGNSNEIGHLNYGLMSEKISSPHENGGMIDKDMERSNVRNEEKSNKDLRKNVGSGGDILESVPRNEEESTEANDTASDFQMANFVNVKIEVMD